MQITTLTFFRYDTLLTKIWAFGMMQFAHKPLAPTPGMQFYKLMGAGKGLGFNPYPDWTTYTLLQTWDSEDAADAFFQSSDLMNRYRKQAVEVWTVYLRTISSHGLWSGQNPFAVSKELDRHNPLVGIITRATIKTSKLRTFWKYVPTSEKPLIDNEHLIFTKGIGEVPVVQMATFSLWDNMESIRNFAYRSEHHQTAIKMTRELKWYSEELFARFQPFKSIGSWQGKDLLSQLNSLSNPLDQPESIPS